MGISHIADGNMREARVGRRGLPDTLLASFQIGGLFRMQLVEPIPFNGFGAIAAAPLNLHLQRLHLDDHAASSVLEMQAMGQQQHLAGP